MRTSWRRLAATAMVGAGIPAAMLLVGVMACGPFFEPEVFVPEHGPQSPKLYADGHVGVVEPGYFHAELVVAYRYLSGAKLSEAEKQAYLAAHETANDPYAWNEQRNTAAAAAISTWQSARAEVAPGTDSPAVSENMRAVQRPGAFELNEEVLNCTDGAFVTAAKTLRARANTWGANSTELKEWLRGQDAVFGNCTGAADMPDPPQPGWPVLLREDRAYQTAAANFYGHKFEVAIADFVAIGKDKVSPWSRWGEYLAARAEVRAAADLGTATAFDDTGLQTARVRLLKIQGETRDAEVRHAVQTELNLIEARLDPAKRMDEAGAALAHADPDFAQDLADLNFLMDHNVTGTSDLPRWIKAIQSYGPRPQVLSAWQAHHSIPWLVAEMSEAKGTDAAGAELMAAAAAVKRESPAYETVNYYRIGWLLNAKKSAEARTVADTVIAGMGPETMAPTRNAFLAERMMTSRSLAEFLADAPRTLIDAESSAAEMAKCTDGGGAGTEACKAQIPPQEFDGDAAALMNLEMPLSVLEQAAENPALPMHLRQAVAEVAWVRALGLGDEASVSRMSRLLPEPVRKTAGSSSDFPATLALLRAPGLRPFLGQGVQRSSGYSNMDHYRDNWWCGRWTDGSNAQRNQTGGAAPSQLSPLTFLTAQQRQQAANEAARLNALPSGLVWTGKRAIAYVKAHPADRDAAETLALVVQGTRWGCDVEYRQQAAVGPQTAVSKEAFEMLHRMYPKSEWAMKTKYYY